MLRRAIELEPTEAGLRGELGAVLAIEGRHQEALASLELARQLAGGADPVYFYDAGIAMADLALGKFQDAINAAHLSKSEFPPDCGRTGEIPWLVLIAAESQSGKADDAHRDLLAFFEVRRFWNTMARVEKTSAFAANPKLLQGLRDAGMPAK